MEEVIERLLEREDPAEILAELRTHRNSSAAEIEPGESDARELLDDLKSFRERAARS